MGSLENVCSVYYSKENPQFQSLMWNLLREINRHEVGFIGEERTDRHHTLNDFSFMIEHLKHRYVNADNAYWHFFRSLEKIPGESDPAEEWETFGFDWALDFDGEGEPEQAVRQTHEELMKLVEYFEENNVQCRVKYSGRRGFHVEMPWEQIKYHFTPDDFPTVAADFARYLIEQAGLDENLVDMGLYKPRGMYRTAYSIHSSTLLVALPLTGGQLTQFPENFRTITQPTHVMRGLELKQRHPVINWVEADDGGLDNIIDDFKEAFNIDETRKERNNKELRERKKWEEKVDQALGIYKGLPETYQNQLEKRIGGKD